MRKLVLYSVVLMIVCSFGSGCDSKPPPSTPTQQPTVVIDPGPKGSQMPVNERVKFTVDISPDDLKPLVSRVTVRGDNHIECKPSEGNLDIQWVWYCWATNESVPGASTVFAYVFGDFDEARGEYNVAVVIPTPTSTDTPTLTPTNTLEPTKPKPTDESTPTFTSAPSEATVVYCTDEGGGGTETIPVEPPRTVARIRIDLEERATDYGFSLWEVEAYGPDTGNTNLVTGREAKASSEQDGPGCEGCFAELAIDGDMNTRWSSEWRDGQWLEIALPDPRVVNRIELKWETAYAQEYCVSVIEPITDISTPTDTPPTPSPVTDTPTPISMATAECPFGASPRTPIGGPAVDVEVEITSPGHCDMGLATSMAAGGTYSGDLTGKEIWILVYPTDVKYYPQTLDACQQVPSAASGGDWKTLVNFGGPPQRYDVVAVVADADGEASQEFKRWLQTGCETGEFPGYLRSELPGGITEVNAITVSTEELTKEPTQEPPEATPPPRGDCPFDGIPFRSPIAGPSVDVEASITSIENCADNLPMASSIPLSGTYSGDLTNKELWVLVYASDLKYYPQSSDACGGLSAGITSGQWGEIIRLGRAGFPEAFHIVLVVTEIGSPASNDFHEYLSVGCTTQNYLGRVLLQPGATELDSIIVHTR